MTGFFRNSLEAMHKDLQEINRALEETTPELIAGLKLLLEKKEAK